MLQTRLLSKSTGQPIEKLERDISRPRYFNPYDAIEYGIIDKVCPPSISAYSPLTLHSCSSKLVQVLEPENDAQRRLAEAGVRQ